MGEIQPEFEYQVGGSLDANAPSYVIRSADSSFYRALKAGQFCYVLNSRQMGKSSLRVRAMQKLRAEGTLCIFIDLTGIGKQDVTPEKWYAGIVQSLVSGAYLSERIQWRNWWRERRDLFSPVQRLNIFLEEVFLREIEENVVIFVDEIDRVLSQNFCLDDFFALIRYCFEQREVNPDFRRLTWALLGVATPNSLIEDKTQTPFNLGQAIPLAGFSLEETAPLIAGWGEIFRCPWVRMAEILDWTGGQPFLTQKLCQLVAQEVETEEEEDDLVERVVKYRIVDNWEAKDEPEHLRTIQDRLMRNQDKTIRLLDLYGQILEQGEINADGTPEQMELRLSGLVIEVSGKLRVFNHIYEVVFDRAWVEKKLNSLRPYAASLAAWQASNAEDESRLLQGEELRSALTWALGKNLGDLDYRYLVASLNLARQSIELANQALAVARGEARRKVSKQRIKKTWIPIIALAVSACLFLVRSLGLLQGSELSLLDRFFLFRPPETTDTRVVVVTIDESDIQRVGQWPFADGVFARAIANIQAQNPAAIGLDIYRDIPVEPGYEELRKTFASARNLYGIEKLVSPTIAPPPVLKRADRVGFSDQVLDKDNKVRRALLAIISGEEKTTHYSLAARLALTYLKTKGIEPEYLENRKVRLGKAIFIPFDTSDGGYVRADAGGYQIPINFRGLVENFLSISFTDLLDNRIPADYFRSKVVIIGSKAESINDFLETPYGRMEGVVLHANMTSHLIAAALDGRPLISTWNKLWEWLWIFVWGAIGALLAWRFQSLTGLIGALMLAATALLTLSYLAFSWGWWLALIPSFLALLAAATSLFAVRNKQRERAIFFLTLEELLEVQRHYPTVGKIAIEYLKREENPARIEEIFKTAKVASP